MCTLQPIQMTVGVTGLAQHIKRFIFEECTRVSSQGTLVHRRCGSPIQTREVAVMDPAVQPQKVPYCPVCEERQERNCNKQPHCERRETMDEPEPTCEAFDSESYGIVPCGKPAKWQREKDGMLLCSDCLKHTGGSAISLQPAASWKVTTA